MYKVTFLPDAEDSFKRLDTAIQKRITEKIDWLAENADKVMVKNAYQTQESYEVFLHEITLAERSRENLSQFLSERR